MTFVDSKRYFYSCGIHISSMTFIQASCFQNDHDYKICRFFNLCWLHMIFDLHHCTRLSTFATLHVTSMKLKQNCILWIFVFNTRLSNLDLCWPLLTSNDHRLFTRGVTYCTHYTHTHNILTVKIPFALSTELKKKILQLIASFIITSKQCMGNFE